MLVPDPTSKTSRAAREQAPRDDAPLRGPVRTCAGCGKREAARDLVRIALGEMVGDASAPAHTAVVDLRGTSSGRGAHVHPVKECLAKAARGGLSRAFKCAIATTADDLSDQLASSAARRVTGLLGGAYRARRLEAGSDVVVEACREGRARLVVVATDASAAAKLTEVREAIDEGRAIAWANKRELGALFGRDEVAVCVVLDDGIADELGRAHQLVRSFSSTRSEAWWSPEVR